MASKKRTYKKAVKAISKMPPAVIITIILVILVALGILIYLYRDQIFKKAPTTTKVPRTAYVGDGELYVYYIDIGATGGDPGEAALIKTKSADILVDSGQKDTNTWDSLHTFLDEYVTDGIIEYAIVTHPDTDHIGNMVKVYENYTVQKTIRYKGTKTATSLKFENKAEEVSEVTIITDFFTNDNSTYDLEIEDGVNLKFLQTGYYTSDDANLRSIVFVLEAYNTRILFNGDAENKPEANYASLCGDVDIMKMGHHGSKNGTYSYLLETIKPEYVIATNGDFLGNEYKHPTYEAISRVYTYSKHTFVYAVTGGNWENDCDGDSDFDLDDRAFERNGTIVVKCDKDGFNVSRLSGLALIEISTTQYWNNTENTYRSLKHED